MKNNKNEYSVTNHKYLEKNFICLVLDRQYALHRCHVSGHPHTTPLVVVMPLVIHIPLRWLSSCHWSSTYHPVGCPHAAGHISSCRWSSSHTTPMVVVMPLVIPTYHSYGNRHAAGHPHTTPMVVLIPLVIHIPLRWFYSLCH